VKQRQIDVHVKEVDEQIVDQVVESFQSASSRLLLLDYDGTLVPIKSRPDEAYPDTEALELLRELSSKPSTEVVVISGRNSQVLEEWLGELPVNIVAEHGASLKIRGQSWQHHTDEDHGWKSMIRNTFELYTGRSPGSFIEEKQYTIAWHYRGMDLEQGFIRSRELLDNLHHMIRNSHLTVLDGNKVVEVRAAGIDKGSATKRIMQLLPCEFVLAIGDDKTDEDIFRVLDGKAVSIRIGQDMTAANYRVDSQKQVIELLSAICRAPVLSQTS
jgi:trehalose 6-phosphate synthase/phosphatase